MRPPVLVLFTFVALFASQSPASDETNREIARTFANYYIQQKDLQSGWSVLRNHLETDPVDAGAWNLLGLIYLEADQPQHALKAFYRAVEKASPKDPERAIYLYNHADAAIRAGNETQARDLLAEAAGLSLTRSSARAALEGLRSGKSLPALAIDAPSRSTASASILSGYDTNVLLFSDGTLASASATGTASPSVSFVLQSGRTSEFLDQSLDTALVVGFTHYPATEARKFDNLSSSLTAGWGQGDDEFAPFDGSVGSQVDWSFLNTNGFRFYNIAGSLYWKGVFRHALRSRTELMLPFGYQNFRVEEGDDPADDRSGPVSSPSLIHFRNWGNALISAGLRLDAQVPRGANYRSLSLFLPLGMTSATASGWQLSAMLEPGFTRYTSSSSGRSDRVLKAGLGVARSITNSLSAGLDYSFRRNVSNVELATYSRHSVMLMVNYELY